MATGMALLTGTVCWMALHASPASFVSFFATSHGAPVLQSRAPALTRATHMHTLRVDDVGRDPRLRSPAGIARIARACRWKKGGMGLEGRIGGPEF